VQCFLKNIVMAYVAPIQVHRLPVAACLLASYGSEIVID
jgi:hypothetical protein